MAQGGGRQNLQARFAIDPLRKDGHVISNGASLARTHGGSSRFRSVCCQILFWFHTLLSFGDGGEGV